MTRTLLIIVLMVIGASSCRLSAPDCDDPTFLRITQDVTTFGMTELYRAAALDCPPTTESLLERASELMDEGDAAEQLDVGRTLWYREEFDLGYSLVCLSAHQRHQDAQVWLAGRYQFGWLGRRHYPGLSPREVDYVEAYKWYSVAFYGIDTGDKKRAELVPQMTPAQIAKAERLVAEWKPNPAECDLR